jgi:hypothetical protein
VFPAVEDGVDEGSAESCATAAGASTENRTAASPKDHILRLPLNVFGERRYDAMWFLDPSLVENMFSPDRPVAH